jgi:hypothetical protein
MKFLVAGTLALVLALPAAVRAQSQATTGVIEGTVRDESGAAIPAATVTLRNTATNFERTVMSDADGRFRGLLLPLGPYRVAVSLTGFATHVREGLELQVGQTINLPVVLKVSALQEEVVVTGEAPVIETTRAEGSDRIDERAIEGLPNNGRNFLDFTKLTPSTVYTLGHIFVVLGRSPVEIASPSPPPRRRAAGTHPLPCRLAGSRRRGCHRAECVLNAKVSYIRCSIGWIVKKFDYINRVTKRFRLRSTRVRRHTLPSCCYASP